MKILHLGTLAACPNAEYITKAFEKLGHKVVLWDESKVTVKEVLKELNEDYDLLLVEEGRLKDDHLSVISPTKENPKRTVNYIRGLFQEIIDKSPVPVVSWLTNLFYGIMQREYEIKTNPIFKADIVFSTDGGHEKEFLDAGVNHILLRQGIHAPEAVMGKPIYDTKAEVGFIGAIYDDIWSYRGDMIKFLEKKYGNRFEHFGQDGSIRHQELNNLLATLKIVVGDSVRSPYYWSNRLYEMLGRGAFLIFPEIEGLDEEFTPYKHYIPYTFGDFEGLKEIIDYYLKHDSQRAKIQKAGLEHCKEYHTYDHRVKKMLEILKEIGMID